jgi:hypothetical protein
MLRIVIAIAVGYCAHALLGKLGLSYLAQHWILVVGAGAVVFTRLRK